MKIRHEISKNRPGSLQGKGARNFVHPNRVKGAFRRQRTAFELLILVLFLALPIIQIGGHPAVFLDAGHREFFIFGFKFWATDVPLMFPIIAGLFVTLMAMTAFLGRFWCGWACPQTVWIDLVYRRLEEWIEGNAHSRMLLDASAWNTERILKRSAKWLSFVVVSVLLSHSFLAYFVSWKGWTERYSTGFAGSGPSLVMMILCSIVFLFSFGWFREQFCLVACPYGRWLTVWMDEKSMVVDYAAWRGEPRRGVAELGQKQGDCINCYHCVDSCPTGVDIRYGVQMECIACTACMDACDEVMISQGKPTGLIRYTSQAQMQDPKTREKPFRITFRIRPMLYVGVIAILMSVFAIALHMRGSLWVYLKKAPGPLYLSSTTPEGELNVMNTFNLSLRNQMAEDVYIRFIVPAIEGFSISVPNGETVFRSGEKRELTLFARFARKNANIKPPPKDVVLTFELEGVDSHRITTYEDHLHFMGPF